MAEPGGERVVLANPIGYAGARIIASPFQFYMDGTDNLRLEGWNCCAGASLEMSGRFQKADGGLEAFRYDLPLTNNAQRNAKDMAMGSGYLLNLVVIAKGATPVIGETFVRVSLIRGFSGATIVLGVMLQGVVTSQQGLGWPGSPITNSIDAPGYERLFSGTTPAPGGAVLETVPTGRRWNVIAAFTSFVASATIATRVCYFEHRPGGQGVSASVHPQTIGAGVGVNLFWAQNFPIGIVIWPDLTTAGLGTPTIALEGDTVRLGAGNMQVGDQFTDPRFHVIENLLVS